MYKYKVSIIIPTYKRKEALSVAIESALNQNFDSFEVIVVDDNNPNTSFRLDVEEIMNEYKYNTNVKYVKHERNMNGAAARNSGISASEGEYITFLDDDDYYLPDKIKIQSDFLDKNIDSDGVYCGRYQKNKIILPKRSGDLSKDILLMDFTPTTPALMFRSSVVKDLGGFDVNFKRHQDYEFLLRYFKKYKLSNIEEPLVVIGSNEGENQLNSDDLYNMKMKFLETFDEVIKELDEKEKGFRKKVYRKHLTVIIINYIKNKHFFKAFKVFLSSYKYNLFKILYNILVYIRIHLKEKKYGN